MKTVAEIFKKLRDEGEYSTRTHILLNGSVVTWVTSHESQEYRLLINETLPTGESVWYVNNGNTQADIKHMRGSDRRIDHSHSDQIEVILKMTGLSESVFVPVPDNTMDILCIGGISKVLIEGDDL